jgi:glycosyltransferase involved in cell wall biosynthesis
MTERVSLVIPAYNAEGYIAEAIDSALAQDYPGLEVIVVDDGSTDSTGDELSRYANRIVVHHQPNAGQSAAMAAGWQLGGGDLLAYLSADDRLRPHAVRRAVEALRLLPETVLVYPDFDVIDARSQRLFTVQAPDFSRRSLFADFTCLPGPGALFRRSAYEQAGAWRTDLKQIPDLDFYLRLGLLGDFHRIPEVLADFRMHADSTTYSPAPYGHGEEPMIVVDSLFARALLPDDVIRWRRRTRANAHLLSASVHARAGRGWSAAKHVAASASSPSAQTPKKTASVALNYLEWQRARRRRRHRDLDAVS